jgi:hypothetical protein
MPHDPRLQRSAHQGWHRDMHGVRNTPCCQLQVQTLTAVICPDRVAGSKTAPVQKTLGQYPPTGVHTRVQLSPTQSDVGCNGSARSTHKIVMDVPMHVGTHLRMVIAAATVESRTTHS